MDKTTWLCVNGASGSNDDNAIRTVVVALGEGGQAPQRVIDVPRDGQPHKAQLVEAGIGRVAVFAGDGTLNSVVSELEGWDGEILVLPGGTANLLSRALHGERDAVEIARSLPALHRVRRPCIRTSQGIALIEILAGPGATWSDVREGLREGDLPEIAASSLAAIRQIATGPMVAVVEPALGRPEGYCGVRFEVAPGGMLIEGYSAETVADYLRQGLALLRRDFRTGPHEDLGAASEILCRSQGEGPIELMIDGERRTGQSDERFSLAELAVDLLASVT